jgi:hypothetical protein
MKAFAWQRFFDVQLREHGKALFTVTELANVARTTRAAVNVELSRLLRLGMIMRYAHGIYGMPGAASAEQLLPMLDGCAYITGLAALVRHGMATQLPRVIDCFTNRRARRTRIATPIGEFLLHTVSEPIFCPQPQGVIAPPAQALCDFIYLEQRREASPETIVTLRHLERLSAGTSSKVIRRYPPAVSEAVRDIQRRYEPGMNHARDS